jgi:hypothetical protein
VNQEKKPVRERISKEPEFHALFCKFEKVLSTLKMRPRIFDPRFIEVIQENIALWLPSDHSRRRRI